MFGGADFRAIQKAAKTKLPVPTEKMVDPDSLPADPGDLETLQNLKDLSARMKVEDALVNIEEHNMRVYERTMREGRGL